LENLKSAVKKKIKELMSLNPTRGTYLDKFEELIAKYNAGDIDAGKLFLELVNFARSLEEEESRHIRENLTEEELVIFDKLTKPEPKLTKKEIEAVRNKYFELITLAEFYGQDTTALKEAQAKAEADIAKKYADEEVKIEEEKEKKKQEARMQAIATNFEMASLALDALGSLNEASAKGDEASQRKVFERNKNIQKAQATIAMAAGIVQQLAVPQDQLTGLNFAKAAALAAAGIANIVKINQTQFNGSVPSPNAGNLNAPTGGANAPAIDFSGVNMLNNAPGTVETYVLAGNVANALEARQKIIDQSYL
jgi:hypothetical protein